MKKLLLSLVLMMGMIVPVMAADNAGAYFKAGPVEFTYPLANASAIALYDCWKGEGLLGMETKLVTAYNFNVNFGAVTSFQANGMPFVSLDYNFGELIANFPPTLSQTGLFFGHDFRTNDNRVGIKASVPLW